MSSSHSSECRHARLQVLAIRATWFIMEFPPQYGRVAQLVRAPASHAGGPGFESLRAHHSAGDRSPLLVSNSKTSRVLNYPAIVAHRNVGWQEREAMRERNLRRSTWLVLIALLAVAAAAVWRVIA